MKEPLNISYDTVLDVLTIDGKRYSGDLFRHFSFVTPEGSCFRIIPGRENDVLLEKHSACTCFPGSN